jgi:hypothetical protein
MERGRGAYTYNPSDLGGGGGLASRTPTQQGLGGNSTEWESSFSQILNRTRQNINRISQRYGTDTGPSGNDNNAGALGKPTLSVYSSTDILRPSNANNERDSNSANNRQGAGGAGRFARSVEDINIGEENFYPSQQSRFVQPKRF